MKSSIFTLFTVVMLSYGGLTIAASQQNPIDLKLASVKVNESTVEPSKKPNIFIIGG